MTNENKSSLRFSVEESIWFQKGQEVEELYSLSLDPSVTVEEVDQYVIIKGSLFLVGEYKREKNNEEEEFEQFSFTPQKTISAFEERDNGSYEFQHHFPVDITIPANRISSLEDVTVTIQTFDYALPEKNCLTLAAELMISGIYGEQQYSPRDTDSEYEEGLLYRNSVAEEIEIEVEKEEKSYSNNSLLYNKEQNDLYIPFEAEAKKLPREEAVQEHHFNQETNLTYAREDPVLHVEEDSVLHIEEETVLLVEEEYQRDALTYQQEETPDYSVDDDYSSQDDFTFNQHGEFSKEESSVTYSVNNLYDRAAEELTVLESNQQVHNQANEEDKREEKSVQKQKSSVSLTDFFGRKEEQRQTSIKVCLVQQGDTLNSIAERYDVSAHAILTLNQLESSSEISEGQVLYIPKQVFSQKR